MADRFVKFKRPVNGFQRSVSMHQGAEASAGRARLRSRETFRPSKRQPFGRGLSHRSAQGMPGRLKLVKPHIRLEKGAQIDSQPIRQPQKSFPLLFAQLLPRHKSFILELCNLVAGMFQFSQLPLKDTRILSILLLTFLSILALSANALMHSGRMASQTARVHKGI